MISSESGHDWSSSTTPILALLVSIFSILTVLVAITITTIVTISIITVMVMILCCCPRYVILGLENRAVNELLSIDS